MSVTFPGKIMCKQQIDKHEKCRRITGNFDCHADVVVHCGAHLPMEHILGLTQSPWMLPSGDCSHRIAGWPPWSMILVENTKH